MNAADRRNIDGWKAMVGKQEPWLASGSAVHFARQIVMCGKPCFRPDGKEAMEADPARVIATCEDYNEAAAIARSHNASIGHWLFEDWLNAHIRQIETAT